MASPQYSTPYSQLSYPSYTPLSVVPVKTDGSSTWSGNGNPRRTSNTSDADLRLLRAAVMYDVARQKGAAAASPPALAGGVHCATGARWPTPDTALAQRRPAGVSVFSAASTRTNAPLYAPQPSQHQHHHPPTSTIRYSDIERVRRLPNAASLPGATRATTATAAVVDGTAVEVQSDVVCAAEAAPYLCAFQEECQSLLALLGAPPPKRPALPPPPVPATAAAPITAAPPSPPSTCSSSSSLPPSLSPVAAAPLETTSTAASAVPASPPTPTTYAQLLREMDQLASLLQQEDNTNSDAAPLSQSSTPTTTSPARPVDAGKVTPEKQARPPHPSSGQAVRRRGPPSGAASRLAPSAAELVAHPPSPFWAAQLLRWVTFLIEKKQGVLRLITAFEATRTPSRRHAGCAEEASSGESAAVKVADGLLRLLRSLNPTTSDVEAWTSGQQRHMCTRVANLLAELTSSEEAVVAALLNDAAAGATMEREGVSKLNDAHSREQPSSVRPTPPTPVVRLPPAYRKDMLETLALLEKLSQENKALKLQLMDAQAELTKLRVEARGEREAKNEVATHFDRVAAQNADLISRLRDAEAKLQEAAAETKPNPQEDALRSQLDRQTSNLRDVRRELDDTKEESDTLRRTVLQLRDALMRHRAVIDLLSRHRRERQPDGSTTGPSSGGRARRLPDSPPMQLIEDILSGVRDAPSSTLSSITGSGEEEEAEEEATYDVSNEASKEAYRA